MLKTRVRPAGHPDLDGAMFISCTNAEVNKFNTLVLNSTSSELVTIEAINIHPTIKNFKAHVNSKGNVGTEKNETPFKQTLELKVGAKVMLTYNIDVLDCLTNGSRGEIIVFGKNDNGSIEKIIIRFDEDCQGYEKRKSDREITRKYPGCTSIERVMFQYSLGKKVSSVSNTAKVVQFPLRLCFATTSHKFQWQTVVKPKKIVVDLRSVFIAAMAYVILSRVQEIAQLFILGELPIEKIYADPDALIELERLDKVSLNNNPSSWEQDKENSIKIVSLNCQSLRNKMMHIQDDQVLLMGDIICLSETWLESDTVVPELDLQGYELHLNSVGHGKGLATYFKRNKFNFHADVKHNDFQMTKIVSTDIEVISVYRSSGSRYCDITNSLMSLLDTSKKTIVCGDFNICLSANRDNEVTKQLAQIGMNQYVEEATHIQGGLIDHIYSNNDEIEVTQYSPYYCANDHDALLVTIL